ncbi:MAG: DUF1361 domain-containing protein [Chloroflexi bacterium]|nr:DUF1361 domain-containing protein [Chloroflexota bacterium]
MIQKFRSVILGHKYKAGVFILLSAASLVCITLSASRVLYSGGSFRYVGLVWNLFLAWIPFVLAFLAYILSWRRALVFIAIPAFAFLWLIFFPNAPYILTDLQHLSQGSGAVPVWYDVIMLIWFSWTGMLLGIVSLNLMQEIIKREFNRLFGWIFVLGVAGLSSAGVYVGRFIRLNSWDILQNPGQTATNIWDWLSDPSLRSVGFIALYTLFFIFVYLTIYAFGHILQEQPRKNQ